MYPEPWTLNSMREPSNPKPQTLYPVKKRFKAMGVSGFRNCPSVPGHRYVGLRFVLMVLGYRVLGVIVGLGMRL